MEVGEEAATDISAIAFGTIRPFATASPSVIPSAKLSIVRGSVP